jgi:eukaryotic-like serine/threonine-protein kinase
MPPAPIPPPIPAPPVSVVPELPNWLMMTEKQALAHIRNAWIAGVAAAALTFIVGLVAANGTSMMQGIDADTLQLSGYVDVTILLVLSFGIYKRIRGCAIAMLIYFFASKLIQFSMAGLGNPLAALIALGLTYIFFQGVRGASAYKIMKNVWSQKAGA